MAKQGQKSMEAKEQLSHVDESVALETGSDEVGYFMYGATDKMFSDSSPVSDESVSDESGDASIAAGSIDIELASQPPVQKRFGQEKVGFVGERNGSLEVIRDGQRVALHEGDAILLKDIVITGDDSGAFLRFTSSKISHQTLRLDEEQRVVIEDFLAESLVAQLDAHKMNWQMSDGSLTLLPSNDDFALGYGAGYAVDSARARLSQADSSGTDSSGTDSSGTDSSGADSSGTDSSEAYSSEADKSGTSSPSSRASEYLAGGASELDYYAYSQPQDFSQEDKRICLKRICLKGIYHKRICLKGIYHKRICLKRICLKGIYQ